MIEIETGGGEGRAEREREFENLQVFYINYPVVKKQKKNRCQCMNVNILRCFIISLFPTKAQRLIRYLLLMQFLIQNTIP